MPPSELSWHLADFRRANIEPPDRLLSNPTACEGELMTETEIEEYLANASRALMVLRDKRSEHYGRVRSEFRADLEYLLKIGRIDKEQYNELTNEESYELPS